MRILFLRHPMRNVGGTGIYTRLLIEELVKKKHTIGLWPTDGMVYKELYDLPIVCMESRLREINSEWDVIVVQHTQTLFYANHIIQQLKDTPHVFISHSSFSNDQIVPYRQLYKVIRIADTINSCWGVPEEMQSVIYNPVDIMSGCSFKWPGKPPYHVLLVSRLNPDRLELVRDIVFAINQMPDHQLHVVGGGLDYLLNAIANDNVVFEGEQVDVRNFYQNADIVIGSGRTAVEAMAYGKPVIIAGLRGLGGLVTPENYERFCKIMFSGRFNGRFNERLPREGLITSILAAQKNANLADIVNKNYQSVKKDFSSSLIASLVESVLHEVVYLHNQIHDNSGILKLKPKLSANCDIIRNGDASSYEIIRLTSGQYLGHMDQGGRKLVAKFNGQHTLQECADILGWKRDDCLSDFILATRQLWFQKIITF